MTYIEIPVWLAWALPAVNFVFVVWIMMYEADRIKDFRRAYERLRNLSRGETPDPDRSPGSAPGSASREGSRPGPGGTRGVT